MVEKKLNTLQLLRLIAVMWNVYLLVLVTYDRLDTLAHADIPAAFFAYNFIASLLFLGMVFAPIQRAWVMRLIPFFIILMGFVPPLVLMQQTPDIPPVPSLHTETMHLRLLPIQLFAMILVAWRYSWRHVVLFALVSALLNYALADFFFDLPSPARPPTPPPRGPNAGRDAFAVVGFLVGLIILFLFLTVGLLVNNLIAQMRHQNLLVQQANKQLREYANVQENLTISNERNRMARELHDTLAHTLTSVTIQLQTAQALRDKQTGKSDELLHQAIVTSREGLSETRRALNDLRANPLEDLGLKLAIYKLAENVANKLEMELDTSQMKAIHPLAPDIEQTIYRIAQEIIANVEYHSRASTLRVSLYEHADRLILEIEDDGIGFNPDQTNRPGHYGLPGLKERAKLINGKLKIQSIINNGTTIRLDLYRDEYLNL
ncbi:MAG: sensor histidine kinase [Chloroflexota bacterium]